MVGVLEQLIGVGRVGAAEDDGRGGHGGGGLAGEVGSRPAWVNFVSRPRSRHVLRPLPAIVVGVTISHLYHIQDVRFRVSFDEVVSSPLNGVHGVPKLPTGSHLFPIFDDAPGHHGNRERHRQPKFHIVPGIIVPSNKIHLHHFSIEEAGMAPPADSLGRGEIPRSLSLVEEEALAESLGVVMAGQCERKKTQSQKQGSYNGTELHNSLHSNTRSLCRSTLYSKMSKCRFVYELISIAKNRAEPPEKTEENGRD
nr:hypothetical protein VIGAN_03027600 [Ipomoea batatas]